MQKDAQDLAFDAMENWGTPEGLEFAKQSLALDPENSDALLLMSSTLDDLDAAKQMIEKAAASAERVLGPNFEKEYKEAFWGFVETRPFMRCLLSLAMNAEQRKEYGEAIKVYERMLKLNPNDNQGVRYVLLCLYLSEKRYAKAEKLLNKYPNEYSAWFAWGRVLYYFVTKDRKKATYYLKKAREQNPYVELYLTGKKPMPEYDPDYYSIGEESEAICAVEDLAAPWYRRQHAMLWLQGQLSGDSGMVRAIAKIIDGR